MTVRTAAFGFPTRCLSVSLIAMVVVAVAGCGSSDTATTTAATTRAAAGPDASGNCPERGIAQAYALTVVNASTTEPLRIAFTEVDCSDWSGTTPMAYGPVTVSDNGSVGMKINPSCGSPAPFTATLAAPGGSSPGEVAPLRIRVENGRCKGEKNKLEIYTGSGWGNTASASVGGSPWSISVTRAGAGRGTVTVSPS